MAGKHIFCVDEESKHKKKWKYHFYESEGSGYIGWGSENCLIGHSVTETEVCYIHGMQYIVCPNP